MEKDKGLFSFRKHPVGNVLDEKKGRKRKGGRLRRSMGFLMAAALIFSTLPASGLVVSASEQEKGLCEHHRSHTAECGYEEAQPCTHECRICPIEDLIAALPEQVTEDNADDVRAQLDHILDLYRELDEGEQEEIDLSRIYALQGALDAANAPMTADGSTEQQATDEASVTINGETLYYATLAEAFADANRQTATITMLTDAECIKSDSAGSPLNITGGNVTLNLNGNALSGRGYGGYGIIDVSGGSLLVQGEESKVKVARRGLSCRGNGKLTVEGITLELVGDDEFFAGSGIHNEGGTVTLNGTQMTGAASDGQIYHYSGTTTINNVTATGVTENCPKSVWYYNEGTLTINGGTFDKITVDSRNYGGVQSVAELLGKGCAYKKQDGTWATADDLAAMEISNVTVEKIPLTINPNGDTSWYYSTQQTHTLAMSAAPVSGGTVTYVWKNGEETLDCTSDAYTVPAGTPVGSYTYTCKATCDGYTLSHTFTFKIEKSGTDLTDGKVKTYNGETETTSFTASDTITVKATPTATGAAPQKAAARLWADPAADQMALFVGDVQVSEPVGAEADGIYTMTVSAADVLLKGNAEPNGNAITLTAKFVGNDNMADGAGTVDVNITAVVKAEKDNAVIGYYGESNLDDAFADSSNADVTFTLLSDVEPNTCLDIQIDCTLDLGGHTITSPTGRSQCVNVQTNATVTIWGEGGITAPSGIALAVNGSVTLEGGTYTGGGNESSSVYVVDQSAMLSVTGEKVSIRNTGGGYGLIVASAQSVQLSAGTYSGTAGAISSTLNFSDMLAHMENIRYAYYQGDALVTTGLDGQALTGTVTVKACTHAYQYAHTTGATTHSQTCPACGDAKDSEKCDFSNGPCPCGAVLAVKLTADLSLTYNGTAQEPSVTVTVDGTPLTEGYSVAYNNNINAGNAAAVTVTGTSFTGTVTLTFSIDKATPTITWSSTSQELTYTGSAAAITAPTITLANNESFTGTISYSYKKQGETAYKNGLPTDAGTYTIKAHVDAAGNYVAADSTGELTLTIKKADAEITVGTAAYHVAYGDPAFTISGITDTNPETAVQYAVTKGTDVVSMENGTVTIRGAGEAEITVSLPESANYNAAGNKTITVTVDKKSGYTVAKLNRSYYYQDGRTESIDLAALLPKDCGNVTYGEPAVSGNVTYSADPAVSGGKLSYTLDSGNVDDAGTIIVTVTTQNFEDITVRVAITRSACDHVAGEILYTGAGERAPACTEDGLGHRECTKCDSVVESGIVVKALGHTVGTATCSRCGKILEESIPKPPQPTHTHSYGTDWKSDSNSHWHECFCGEKAHIAAHTEDGGSVTKPATETETGIRTYKCSICGYVMRTEIIDKLSSTETQQETVTSEQMRKNSEKLDSGIVINFDGNKFNLSWKKVGGAEGYDIFAAPYGKTKLDAKSLIKTVKGNKTSVSLAKIDGKKVYQVQIKAWRYVDGKKVYIGSSSVYHVAGKANTKYTNAKKLQPAKKKYALKKGMSIRIKVTVIKQSKKKLLPKSHGSALRYESSNKEIATVTSNGKVKAKKKGTCYITVTALNGVKTKIKIMVK